MAIVLTILYRGPLTTCDYDCWYCPFAKRASTPDELEEDRVSVERFVRWVESQDHAISVLFTPYGEALVHPWYRSAMRELSHMPHVTCVAAQTNLSVSPDWLRSCNLDTLALLCSYHPSQVSQERFIAHCRMMDGLGARYSVGCVGIKEEIQNIERLRGALAPQVYLWINAYKHQIDYYSAEDIHRLESIDPMFRLNNWRYRSIGRACRTGREVISLAGDGTASRCHFCRKRMGNIYTSNLESFLRDEPCPMPTCGCHIGYVHIVELGIRDFFGKGWLTRIPDEPVWHHPDAAERTKRSVALLLKREAGIPASTQTD